MADRIVKRIMTLEPIAAGPIALAARMLPCQMVKAVAVAAVATILLLNRNVTRQ
jgi:hypothetical protein